MMLVYGMAEFLSTFIEGFIAYLVFSDIFANKRKRGNRKTDMVLSLVITTMVLFCNQFVLFSYFTLILVEIYLSVSVWMVYGVNYITAFSVMSFYLVCMNFFDFFILITVSDFFDGSQTLDQILSSFGLMRAIVITIVNSLWAALYLFLRKYLKRLSVELKAAYLITALSLGGFIGFIFLSQQALKMIDDSKPALWFFVLCFLASMIFISYFAVMQKEEKHKVSFLEMRHGLLNENYNFLTRLYSFYKEVPCLQHKCFKAFAIAFDLM